MNRRTWWIAVAIVGIIALALAGVSLRHRYLGSGADTRSKSADQVLVQARDLIGEGRYLEASRLLDDLVKREPWNDAAWALRAEALRPRGYEDFAVGQLFEIWREKPGSLKLQNDTDFFLQDWQFYTNREGRELIQLYATDSLSLLHI